MLEKRRDKKGRILKNGENQRKDGRYLYKYVDNTGTTQYVYSWKLVATDRVPKGKRDCLSLREKEQEIHRDITDGINTAGKKITVCQLYAKQNEHRANVKKSTQIQRQYLMKILEEDKLGAKPIDSVKLSDAKEWAIRMKKKGIAYKSISNYKRTLKASFYIAIQDDLIRKNPFDFKLSEVIENDTEPRKALTEEQEERLLNFVKHDKVYQKYYNDIVILLKTGLRISELCGLTIKDIDFDSEIIHVTHQLLRNKNVGYYIETPKTKSGLRDIPMSNEVIKALKRVIESDRYKHRKVIDIDCYRDFLFLNGKGYPMTGDCYRSVFINLIKKYNKKHEDTLPKITPHVLRHTFCTRLANKNINPKSLQYIMGHSNISITLNLYAHASLEGMKAEIKNLVS